MAGARRRSASDAAQPSIAERSARLGARWRRRSASLVDGSVRCEASQRTIASRSYVTLRALKIIHLISFPKVKVEW